MCRIYGSRRNLSNCVRASEEDREKAYEKAEKLLLDLESEYPTFVKSMLPSHVSGGFWLVSCSLLVSYACYFYVHLCSLFLNFCSLSLTTASNIFYYTLPLMLNSLVRSNEPKFNTLLYQLLQNP